MKFENIKIYNFEGALRGMRNPMNSWEKSDSAFGIGHTDEVQKKAISINPLLSNKDYSMYINYKDCIEEYAIIGPKDMALAQRLILAGNEHRKFMRQIFITVDITAPLYWWKEFDTYQIGVIKNSTSTMHKLASTPITLDCFELDDFNECIANLPNFSINYQAIIEYCEQLRQTYLKTQDKRYWKELIRWLPEGWLQTRTVTMNYENLRNIYFQRRNHKLTEWSNSFISFIKELPYASQFIMYENDEQ